MNHFVIRESERLINWSTPCLDKYIQNKEALKETVWIYIQKVSVPQKQNLKHSKPSGSSRSTWNSYVGNFSKWKLCITQFCRMFPGWAEWCRPSHEPISAILWVSGIVPLLLCQPTGNPQELLISGPIIRKRVQKINGLVPLSGPFSLKK